MNRCTRVQYAPVEPLTNGCACVLFCQTFGFCFSFGYLGLKKSHISSGKRNFSSKARQGHIEHVCKMSESGLSKTAWIFRVLCVKSGKITAWHPNYLVTVNIRFRALNLALYWSYAGMSPRYLCETLYNYALEHLEAARP